MRGGGREDEIRFFVHKLTFEIKAFKIEMLRTKQMTQSLELVKFILETL